MRKGENYNTGVTPNLRPKNKKNSKARVKRAFLYVCRAWYYI